MADTRVQLEVEDWVRKTWLLEKLGQPFSRERIKLTSGGVFDFDAVNGDSSIVASISTSRARTATGKHGVGKMMKLRSDMFFLLLAPAKRRLVILTDQSMFDACQKELGAGRIPASIEILYAEIPDEMGTRLESSQQAASREVSPRG